MLNVMAITELLQEATELCAAVGGTPVDNAAANASLSTQPGAQALYTSYQAADLASSKLAIASSESVINSLEDADGSSVASRIIVANMTTSATVRMETAASGGSAGMPGATATAPGAIFTGGADGRRPGIGGFAGSLGVVIWGFML